MMLTHAFRSTSKRTRYHARLWKERGAFPIAKTPNNKGIYDVSRGDLPDQVIWLVRAACRTQVYCTARVSRLQCREFPSPGSVRERIGDSHGVVLNASADLTRHSGAFG